jgi:hypothetical protein
MRIGVLSGIEQSVEGTARNYIFEKKTSIIMKGNSWSKT